MSCNCYCLYFPISKPVEDGDYYKVEICHHNNSNSLFDTARNTFTEATKDCEVMPCIAGLHHRHWLIMPKEKMVLLKIKYGDELFNIGRYSLWSGRQKGV